MILEKAFISATICLLSNSVSSFVITSSQRNLKRGNGAIRTSPIISHQSSLCWHNQDILSKISTVQPLHMAVDEMESDDVNGSSTSNRSSRGGSNGDSSSSRRKRIRKRVTDLARKIVVAPIQTASNISPMPQAVASVLKDATLGALDMAVDEVIALRSGSNNSDKTTKSKKISTDDNSIVNVTAMVEDAFLPVEQSLEQMEVQLALARKSLDEAKQQSIAAMEAVEAAAIAQAEGAVQAVAAAKQEASAKVLADIYVAAQESDSSKQQILEFEDVDYGTSEMAPPFLDDDQCLVPGEPIVRVEKAPENSRRIFAGIDVPHSVDEVWSLLTDYAHLQDVVPNLVTNEVLEEYVAIGGDNILNEYQYDDNKPEEIQCREISQRMKGAKLRQVGGAKVAGIQFSARTTLEVREWPTGLPDFAHFNDEYYKGKSRKERAKDYTSTKLTRYKFPRPFAISKLPTRDISMQSIEDDDGEFRMYQGVWRMQPLPGCAPEGQQAMRLTYAVEVSPRAYLPVQLIEGRIVRDLCTNLVAIRDYLATKEKS